MHSLRKVGSKHHRFYVEWSRLKLQHGKMPFCIISKLSKFTQLFNAVVYMAFLKSYNIYCLQIFNFDGQEDDQAAYDLSPSW